MSLIKPRSYALSLASLCALALALSACQTNTNATKTNADATSPKTEGDEAAVKPAASSVDPDDKEAIAPLPEVPEGSKLATFGGGCFWCMEPPFEKLDGVYAVTSGYSGGPELNPTYKQVSSGETAHVEVVQVLFDPSKVSYDKLLDVYWRQIDPTQVNGQFADHGSQYRTVIFVHDDAQRELAQKSKQALEDSKRFDKPIAVTIEPYTAFWPAEVYHQDFYKKSPDHYKAYRRGSGRQGFIDRVWGDEAK